MDKFVEALIGAGVALAVPSATFLLSKRYERRAELHIRKLHQYQELILAISDLFDVDHLEQVYERLGRIMNTMYLVASNDVVKAMIELRNQISEDKPDKTIAAQEMAFASLIWFIRKDLGDIPTNKSSDFVVKFSPYKGRVPAPLPVVGRSEPDK